jgi:hypothetical protein
MYYPNYPGSRPGTHAATHGPGGTDPLNVSALGLVTTEALAEALALLVKHNASSNASGNTTLSIASTTRVHTEIITFSGTTRTSVVVLPVAGRLAGDRVTLRLENPASAAISQEIRNASAAGDILYSCFSNDGDAVFEVYFDGTAFQPLSNLQPVA